MEKPPPAAPTQDAPYLTDAMGDVFALLVDGQELPVDPDSWGWSSTTRPDGRRSVEELQGLPGFTITVEPRPDLRFRPGPKPKRPATRAQWLHGEAPPAMAFSKAGAADGTSGRYNRLSDALGYASSSLPRNPQSGPFHVWDVVKGELVTVDYTPSVPTFGKGHVYVIEDGLGIKIGHTTGELSVRINGLQTGNPRLLTVIAVISPAGEDVEAHLHRQFAAWRVRGEWFDRSHVIAEAQKHRGWEPLLRRHLPAENWSIELYPPYG
jgi:hypothetical protein